MSYACTEQAKSQGILLLEMPQVLSKRVKVSESTELMSAGVLEDDVSDIRQSLNELVDNYSET